MKYSETRRWEPFLDQAMALGIPERHQVLAEQPDAGRWAIEFGDLAHETSAESSNNIALPMGCPVHRVTSSFSRMPASACSFLNYNQPRPSCHRDNAGSLSLRGRKRRSNPMEVRTFMGFASLRSQ
jgi:hypothetical protein